MNKSTKKRIGVLALAGALSLSLAMSFAYFTDRVEVTANVTGGTVGIIQDAGTGDAHDWTKQLQDGPQDLDNINPGDSRSLAFTVTNTGTKAIDVRHTIKLSVVDAAGNAKAMTEGEDVALNTLAQFDIYKASDVTATSNGNGNAGYVIKPGAQPVFSSDTVDSAQMGAKRTFDSANGTVTYYFADTILDGTGANAETGYAKAEQVATTLEASDVVLSNNNTAVTYDYVLIFRDTTLNDFQGCQLYVQMVVEAKQHLNTNSSWKNIETVVYQMDISGKTVQDTTINTAPNNQTGVLEAVTDGSAGTYNTNTAH